MSNILTWDEYFIGLAKLSQRRSKDPDMQVGAVIVTPEKRIVGIGYNGFPDNKGKTRVDNDIAFPWGKVSSAYSETKHAYVIHAEENAIINATRKDLSGCTMYVTHFPCNHCSKILIQNGITELVYDQPPKEDDKHLEMYTASYNLLRHYGVTIRQVQTKVSLRVTRQER